MKNCDIFVTGSTTTSHPAVRVSMGIPTISLPSHVTIDQLVVVQLAPPLCMITTSMSAPGLIGTAVGGELAGQAVIPSKVTETMAGWAAEAVGTPELLNDSSSPKINATLKIQNLRVRWPARGLAESWVAGL